MGISVSGLVSGLDTASIISQLQAVEQQPIVALQQQEAAYQVELSAYSTLQGNLTSLQTAAGNLESSSNISTSSATSSNTSLLTATTTTGAVTGSHTITVNSLAAAQKLNSAAFTGTEAVGAGTIHLKIGNTSTDIAVSSTDTISNVANSINSANAGVTANVIYDGANYYLTLTSQNAGTANTMNVTVTKAGTLSTDPSNLNNTGLSRLVYDSTSGTHNLTQQQAAANANISVDGITNITRSSNTISDVLPGVTLNLQGADTSTPVTLTIQQDYSTLESNINTFVTAYNSLVGTLNAQQSYDSSTQTAGTLFGDSTTNMIQSQITNAVLNAVPGLTSGYNTLAAMGVTLATPGDSTQLSQLQFNSATLQSALNSNPTAVASFFTSTATTVSGATTGVQGFSATLSSVLSNILDSTSGSLTSRTQGIQSTLTSMDQEISDMTTRLNDNQTRLQTQFSSLEVILSDYKNTANSLTSQLAQLSNNWASISSSSSK